MQGITEGYLREKGFDYQGTWPSGDKDYDGVKAGLLLHEDLSVTYFGKNGVFGYAETKEQLDKLVCQ